MVFVKAKKIADFVKLESLLVFAKVIIVFVFVSAKNFTEFVILIRKELIESFAEVQFRLEVFINKAFDEVESLILFVRNYSLIALKILLKLIFL